MICPAPAGTRYGNRVTALRWVGILRHLGHRVRIAERWEGKPCDLLLALHAWRSAETVLRFGRLHPEKPVLVALTGTDLYRDIHRHREAQQALERASRLVALQPLAAKELPPHLGVKIRVIYQSAKKTKTGKTQRTRRANSACFDVCVIGHLRKVKDPFRAALASCLLPKSSRVRILQAGAAREEAMAQRAQAEQKRNPRYRWLGELSRSRVRRLMAGSRLLVLSSIMEGGANVISEALVDRVPVLASRIPGSVGLLGRGYPGYFPARDTAALARLLRRAEVDVHFYRRLKTWCARRAHLFRPSEERARWKKLLRELGWAASQRQARPN